MRSPAHWRYGWARLILHMINLTVASIAVYSLMIGHPLNAKQVAIQLTITAIVLTLMLILNRNDYILPNKFKLNSGRGDIPR